MKVDRVDYFISHLLIPTHTVSSDVEQSSESYILEAVPAMLYALLIHHHSFQHIGGGKYLSINTSTLYYSTLVPSQIYWKGGLNKLIIPQYNLVTSMYIDQKMRQYDPGAESIFCHLYSPT